MRVAFYFDFVSIYAYLGWRRVIALSNARGDIELVPVPVLFAGLLDHHGQLGPAEIPAKRAYVFADGLRQARLEGFSFRGPASHPFSPLTALRLCLPEVAGTRQLDIVDALFEAGWGQGGDYGDPHALTAALDRLDLDGGALLERTREPEIKEALKRSTSRAIDAGVFGVPTFALAGDLIWGADRVHHVEALLDGKDLLDRDLLEEILARPRAADRKRGR